jgi:hypothetical protein
MIAKPGHAVGFAEYYLRHMEKVPKLTSQEKKFFWAQRSWHPVVKMRWIDETVSDGAGVTTYPDGTIRIYDFSPLDKRR